MNVIRWVKSVFARKIPKEYYIVELSGFDDFVVVEKRCDAYNPISVLRWKLDKKFGATTNRKKAERMCRKINIIYKKITWL